MWISLFLTITQELGEAMKIVEELGQLPLALDQVGAYISSLQIDFSSYRKRASRNLEAVLRRPSAESDLPLPKSSVLSTWELSFQELDEDAAQLLHICAFLSNEDIPEELFRRGKTAVKWVLNGRIQGLL